MNALSFGDPISGIKVTHSPKIILSTFTTIIRNFRERRKNLLPQTWQRMIALSQHTVHIVSRHNAVGHQIQCNAQWQANNKSANLVGHNLYTLMDSFDFMVDNFPMCQNHKRKLLNDNATLKTDIVATEAIVT